MYYKFEERNCCPQCGGALSHVGSINTLEMFECIECGTRYSVKRRYRLDSENHAVFD